MVKKLTVATAILFYSTAVFAQGSLPPEKRPMIHYESAILELKDGLGCSILSKPFEVIPGPRVVLTWAIDGSGKLNPKESVYPRSTDLKELSYEAAKELFGPGQNEKDGITTFCLMLASGTGAYRAQHSYRLDTKFENGKLQAYRVSGETIRNPQWLLNE